MAVRFNADGQDYTRSISGTGSGWSAAGWFKISTDRNTNTTFLGFDASGDYLLLRTASNGTTIGIYANDGTHRATRSLTAGTWYFLGLSTSNGSSGTLVSRSASDTSFTVASWTGFPVTPTTLRIGESHFGSEWLNGCVAALKIWTGAVLTQAELEQEAWTYQPNRTADLFGWYPFVRAETTDYSGNGNTLSGGSGASTEDGPPIRWGIGRRRFLIPFTPVPAEATPDPIAAATTLPAPTITLGAGASPSTISLLASIPDPAIYTTGGRDAEPDPIAVAATLPAPTVHAERTWTATPQPILAAADLPEPDAAVPFSPGDLITSPNQIEYAGTLLGTQTIRVHAIRGWDGKPAIDSTNTERANRHGSYPGRKFARERLIGVTLKLWAPDNNPETLAGIIRDLQMATPLPPDDTEFPIVIRNFGEPMLTYGVVTDLPIDNEPGAYNVGTMEVQMLITCSDPLKLSPVLHGVEIADGGEQDVLNLGNEATYPIAILPGPFSDPVLTATWPDGTTRILQWDIDVDEGETLVFDTDAGTATVGEENVMSGLGGSSVAVMDWVLPPGVTNIAYETTGGDAPNATVRWRDAIL